MVDANLAPDLLAQVGGRVVYPDPVGRDESNDAVRRHVVDAPVEERMEEVATGEVREDQPIKILQDLRQMPIAQVGGIACTEPEGAWRRPASEEVPMVNDSLRGFVGRRNRPAVADQVGLHPLPRGWHDTGMKLPALDTGYLLKGIGCEVKAAQGPGHEHSIAGARVDEPAFRIRPADPVEENVDHGFCRIEDGASMGASIAPDRSPAASKRSSIVDVASSSSCAMFLRAWPMQFWVLPKTCVQDVRSIPDPIWKESLIHCPLRFRPIRGTWLFLR